MKRFAYTLMIAWFFCVLVLTKCFAEETEQNVMDLAPTTDKTITFNGIPWGASREEFLESVYYLCSGEEVVIEIGNIDWNKSEEEIYKKAYYLCTGDELYAEDILRTRQKVYEALTSGKVIFILMAGNESYKGKWDDTYLFKENIFPQIKGSGIECVSDDYSFANSINIGGYPSNKLSGYFYYSPIDQAWHLFSAEYSFERAVDYSEAREIYKSMKEDLRHKLSALYGVQHVTPENNCIWIGDDLSAVYLEENLLTPPYIIYGDLSISEKFDAIKKELQTKEDETLDYTGL